MKMWCWKVCGVVGLAILLGGCWLFKSEVYLHVTAKVEGGAVLVQVDGQPTGTKLVVSTKTKKSKKSKVLKKKTIKDGYEATTFAFPLEDFKKGTNTIKVKATHDGNTGSRSVKIKAPGKAERSKLFLHVVDCKATSGTQSMSLKGEFGEQASCNTQEDQKVTLSMVTSPKAKITIGDSSLSVKERIQRTYTFSLKPYIQNIDLDKVINASANTLKIKVPVKITKRKKKTVKGNLEFHMEGRVANKLAESFFVGVTQGKPLPGSKAPVSGERKSLVYMYGPDWKGLASLGNAGSLKDVDLIAVIRELPDKRDGGSCGPYTDSAGGIPLGSMKRYLVDQELVLYQAHDAKELQRKTFEGGDEGCPSFVTSYDGVISPVYDRASKETVRTWLYDLVQNKPASKKAPKAGRRGSKTRSTPRIQRR